MMLGENEVAWPPILESDLKVHVLARRELAGRTDPILLRERGVRSQLGGRPAFQRCSPPGTACAEEPNRRLQAMAKAYPPEDLARRVFLLVISGITLQIAAIVFLLLI